MEIGFPDHIMQDMVGITATIMVMNIWRVIQEGCIEVA